MDIYSQHNDAASYICNNISLAEFKKIQTHGALLVLDNRSLEIIQYSKNSSEFLRTPIIQLRNQNIIKFLANNSGAEVDIISWLIKSEKKFGSFIWKGKDESFTVWVYVHQQKDIIILEIERTNPTTNKEIPFSVVDDVINLTYGSTPESIEEKSMQVCAEIQRITDYDRVILYRFETDASGVAIGEALKNGMKSYLGLRFPATDVPYYVRQMYLCQPMRYIPNIDADTAPLVPESTPRTNTPIDVSNLLLRAVSPVHVEYLRNMESAASLSIALIQDDRLWGLIACQHRQPKHISMEYRFGLLLFAKIIMEQMLAIDNNKNDIIKKNIFTLKQTIENAFNHCSNLFGAFEEVCDTIAKMFSADGVTIYYQGRLLICCRTPSQSQTVKLIDWLFENHRAQIFASHQLPLEYADSSNFAKKAAGLLAIPLTPGDKNYILLFRKESVSTLLWAGDPNNVIIELNNKYLPRSSFKPFKQIIKNQSIKWHEHEIIAAKDLQSMIINKQYQLMLEGKLSNHLPGQHNLLQSFIEETFKFTLNYNGHPLLFLDKSHMYFSRDGTSYNNSDILIQNILFGGSNSLQTHVREEGLFPTILHNNIRPNELLREPGTSIELNNERFRLMQMQLEESINKYTNLYNFSPGAHVTLNEAGFITNANNAAAKLLCMEKKFLIETRFSNYVSEDTKAQFYQHLEQTKDKKAENCYLKLITDNQKTIYTKLSSLEHNSVSSYGNEIILFITDITLEKQYEKNMHDLQLKMHHKDRLALIEELASMIVHELNQPLGVIANYANGCIRRLERDDVSKENLLYALEKIIQATHRTDEIYQRLKYFKCKSSMTFEFIKIDDLVNGVIMLIKNEIADESVSLRYRRTLHIPEIMLDRVHIEQAILNLARNAIEAMKDSAIRDPTLIIETEIHDSHMISINVIDNGPGFSPAIADKLFDANFTTKSYGIGLGLAISSTVIEAHDGKLEAASPPEGGACFKIKLPINRASI